MADSLAVFNAGKIAQIGTPAQIYSQPRSPFVANFVGSSNILPPPLTQALGGPAQWASLRPEALRVVELGPLSGPVTVVRYLGGSTRVTILARGQEIAVLLPAGAALPAAGDRLTLGFDSGAIHVMEQA